MEGPNRCDFNGESEENEEDNDEAMYDHDLGDDSDERCSIMMVANLY